MQDALDWSTPLRRTKIPHSSINIPLRKKSLEIETRGKRLRRIWPKRKKFEIDLQSKPYKLRLFFQRLCYRRRRDLPLNMDSMNHCWLPLLWRPLKQKRIRSPLHGDFTLRPPIDAWNLTGTTHSRSLILGKNEEGPSEIEPTWACSAQPDLKGKGGLNGP